MPFRFVALAAGHPVSLFTPEHVTSRRECVDESRLSFGVPCGHGDPDAFADWQTASEKRDDREKGEQAGCVAGDGRIQAQRINTARTRTQSAPACSTSRCRAELGVRSGSQDRAPAPIESAQLIDHRAATQPSRKRSRRCSHLRRTSWTPPETSRFGGGAWCDGVGGR